MLVLDEPLPPPAADPTPAEPDPDPAPVPELPRWVWFVTFGLFVQYAIVGYWLVSNEEYMIGDAIARTVSATVMVFGRDPHLGAMGFYWPPLPMFLRVPFVVVLAPFGKQLLAGPLGSALPAALVVPVLVKLCLFLRVRPGYAVLIVGIYALNPVTLFSAANAMSESTFALFLALTFLGFARFHRDRSVGSLMYWGFALGGGVASRIEFVPLTFASVVAACLLVPKHRWRQVAWTIALPPAFVMLCWTAASSLIAGDAFFWYTAGKASGTTPESHPWMPAVLTPASIAGYVGYLLVVVTPGIVLLVLVAPVIRREWRGWCGIAMLTLTVPAFVWLQLQMRTSWGNPRYVAVLPVCLAAAALWAVAQIGDARSLARWSFQTGFVVLGAVGAIVAPYVYSDPVQTGIEQESVFFAALTGRPRIDYPERFEPLHELLDVLEPELANGKFVAMDSRLGTVLLLTEHLDRFILPEDREFEQIMSDPTDRFDYAILQTEGSSSSYSMSISAAMNAVEGGRFEPIGDYGLVTLWQFVPIGRGGT